MKRNNSIATVLLIILLAAPLADVYAQNAINWIHNNSAGPSPRTYPLMAYDSDRKVVVLYGGFGRSPYGIRTDTWEWNGDKWTEIKIPGAGKHWTGAMAYDAARKQMVLFGGTSSTTTTPNPSTWLYDGKAWTKANPATSPQGRMSFTMAYDSRRKKILIYGGYWDGNHIALSELWEWNGSNWSYIGKYDPHPAGDYEYGPEYRSRHQAAFDSRRGVMVMYGGVRFDPGIAKYWSSDTWEWNGTSWVLKKMTGFDSREFHGIVYDSIQKRCVLFGGENGNSKRPTSTMVWTGNTWKKLVTANSPPGHIGHAMAYDSNRNEVLLFGGYAGESYTNSSGLWALGYKHDLSIKRVKGSPSAIPQDGKIKLSAVVRNKGKGASQTYHVHFYLSEDKVHDKKDFFLSAYYYDPLLKGKKYKFTEEVNLGTFKKKPKAGDYYIVAAVWDQFHNNDANQNNNESYCKKPIEITK